MIMNDALVELLDTLEEEYGIYIHPNDFTKVLGDYGFMIVPIEDPTNLRYGSSE